MWKLTLFLAGLLRKKGSTSTFIFRRLLNCHSAVWIVLVTATLGSEGCGPKTTDKGPAKHYQLTGKIISVNSKDQTASIDAAAIPNYMEAMTMNYPIAKKSELHSLHPGDVIRATVNVYESGDFDLSSIEKTNK